MTIFPLEYASLAMAGSVAKPVETLKSGVGAVLLDSMGPDTPRRAVGMVGGRAITEASGRILGLDIDA